MAKINKEDLIKALSSNENVQNKNVQQAAEQIADIVIGLVTPSKKPTKPKEVIVLYDASNGKVIAKRCVYHKKYEVLSIAEFGAKNTNDGYNTMCKEGVIQWTIRNKKVKAIKDPLVAKLTAGKPLSPDETHALLQETEDIKKQIVPREDGHGFDTVEDTANFLAKKGIKITTVKPTK